MKHFFYCILPAALAAVVIGSLSIMFQACWTLKQGITLIGYLNRAVPLESIANEDEDAALFVSHVNDIRRFTLEELSLSATKNYTKYVSLDRDYLASIVSASAKDSFKRHQWWFPVVGSVPYKGFFNIEDAKHEALRLKKKGLDVIARPVDAFSTLGWFNDPLYSFMREYSEARLADLIIHESFHATLFLKSNAQFNEEIAEFIGTEGARLYIEKKYGADSEAYTALAKNERDNKMFVFYIKSIITELESLYSMDIPREEKLRRKEEIINASQQRFLDEYDSVFKTNQYRFAGKMKINNAYLELYRLYHEGDDRLKSLYESAGSNLPEFIAAAKTLNNKSDPYIQLKRALEAQKK
ncbi:MAG: aminopeptidase [Spirochaetaceae bacterium]|jgi:predicted aminopeptidase|nr:aminopeptidase [Spirochaetaceae bacterium]GMO22244.1 MAG: aminopeptidase [Termitinemataceae bacterium]